MKPEEKSQILLAITRSKAKMYEYNVPIEDHIKIPIDPAKLFSLAIGILGDFAPNIDEVVNEGYNNSIYDDVQFSAHFFDNYLQSHLNDKLNPYLLLLGSASYYLCDLPGSSVVLAKYITDKSVDLKCQGLEELLLWLLIEDFSIPLNQSNGLFGEYIHLISNELIYFYQNGTNQEKIFNYLNYIRRIAYENGTPRQLLFSDIICAIIKKRIKNSTWICLPKLSKISIDLWSNSIKKKGFIKELWPAQLLIGEKGIYEGKSGIVQMPTSAGKTRASEIIIRSAFLSRGISLAVIVAPFRALCHEISDNFMKAFRDENVIVNELSDVYQTDFDISQLLTKNHILIVTPEKLIYVLRHSPEIASKIGLLIYDEGHQFDSGSRGITYELLLTTLKAMVSSNTQTLLMSAVISNAEEIGIWLNGSESIVVSGQTLLPTFRTVAFTSWDRHGSLEFVDPKEPDTRKFFVPHIIEQLDLNLNKGERKKRVFPEKNEINDIALFLGLKLFSNGSVAIFCGRKDTVCKIAERTVEIFNRSINLKKPLQVSTISEVEKLHYLFQCNFGKDAIATKSAELGIFTHHSDLPNGIRLAVEYAMKKGHIKFVICTSTLAQGVNLPIRYLIVTSVYQGHDRIKVRDFHNLIGRAGRAGMHTEGSIIFADPRLYDKRMIREDKWRWNQVKKLLDPNNSEPCASTLLSLFEPLRSDDGKNLLDMHPLDFIKEYFEDAESLKTVGDKIAANNKEYGFTKNGIEKQIIGKLNIIYSLENYLMSQWSESKSEIEEEKITELAKGTLAYFLSKDDEERENIIELFKLISHNIIRKANPSRLKVFGRTLFGIENSLKIEKWVIDNIEKLKIVNNCEELLDILWPIIRENIQNATFRKFDNPDLLYEIVKLWLNARPFYELYKTILDAGVKIKTDKQSRKLKIEQIVNLCENAFSYDGTLIVGAVIEFVKVIQNSDLDDIVFKLQVFQKMLKYGLPNLSSIIIYELGFSDRVISTDLDSFLRVKAPNKEIIMKKIKQKKDDVTKLINKYPDYFRQRLESILQ